MIPDNAPIPNPPPAWKSPWFCAIIGIVGVVLGANVFMAFFAVRSNPGLVTKDYYERGKSFVHRAKPEYLQQNKLDWELDLAAPGKIIVGKSALFRLAAKEKDAAPLVADSATLFIYRPSDSSKDFSMPMAHEGGGVYSVMAAFPLPGVWDIIAEIQKGSDRQNLARRIAVEAP